MENNNISTPKIDSISNKVLGTLLFGLRMTAGWMFFSAFLRRVILAPEKLDPEIGRASCRERVLRLV